MMRMLTANSEVVEGMTDQNRNSAFESFLDPLPEVTVQPTAGDSKAEREQRSLALEKTYVYDVYEQIAPQVIESRHRPWPKIRQFLLELEPGSLVCDVGCGNGKYLDINPDVYKIGSDQCYKLAEGAKELGHEVLSCDNMALPFREESFDAVLSIAVVHHFATTERRVQALRELARILRIGGRLMITAWALEQRHRKFESQDVLVPWHKPKQSSSEEQTSLDKEITSTTTSEDDLLNYHAYTSGMESEPYFVPTCYPKRRHKLREGWAARHHHRGRALDSRHSSSQSSSDLSSPNETCYSFVRRALQKLSSGKSWDDPHQRCRPPWFLQSMDSAINGNGSDPANDPGDKQDSLDSNENADDIPIELHDVDSSDICEEFGRRKCKESACRKYSLQQTRPEAKSQSAKHLKRSSSGDSPPPPKSKSLSDILSLFAVNFSYSRKSSQDSTSRSSSSSLTKHSSSSSVDSKSATTKLGRSVHHPPNGCVVRSKSTHFTLAKVDEDNEQNAPQHPVTPPPQQRWSVAGYPNCDSPAKPKTCSRRPQSLVLGRDVHIPRTLSAEDHKNGNTILPDLDSCLAFYGLAGGKDEDFLSPPYTKAEAKPSMPDKTNFQSNAMDEVPLKNRHRERSPTRDATTNYRNAGWTKNDRNASLTLRLDVDKRGHQNPDILVNASEIRKTTSLDIAGAAARCNDVDGKYFHQDIDHKPPLPPGQGQGRRSWSGRNFQVLTSSLRKDTWKDLFYSNMIKQIIDREHLFPYHSMPNLRAENGSSPSGGASYDAIPPYKRFHFQRRFSQPYTSLQQLTSGKAKLDCATHKMTNDPSRNGLKKRSFSMDVDQRPLASSSSLEEMAMVNAKGVLASKNRCLTRRRSCVVCNCSGAVMSIKHSRSVGDATFNCLQMSSCSHAVKVGHNKIIAKEDSLQSDTSVDSDDSVASVIAVRRNPSLDMTSYSTGLSERQCSERHCSTCSKDSSNLSDTSVDSEESCVSVIAMPLRRLDNVEGQQEDEVLEDACQLPINLEKSTSNIEVQTRPKLRCCRQKSLELENFVPEDEGDGVPTMQEVEDLDAEDVRVVSTTHLICDPAATSERSLSEAAMTSDRSLSETAILDNQLPDSTSALLEGHEVVHTLKTCISWEKYLDACESMVFDSIFYVNATHEDFSGERSLGITQLLPDVCEHYENSFANVRFLDSEIPLVAETCWLDCKSSESLDDFSDSGELPSLSEDILDEDLKLEIVEDVASDDGNSPNFPPGSPQGRLLEAAVHVANSLQSAMTVAVTSGGRRKDLADQSCQLAAPDSPHCASGKAVPDLPEGENPVASLPALILSESMPSQPQTFNDSQRDHCEAKNDSLPSRQAMQEIEIREFDDNLDDAMDSEMSECIGPSFEMPSDEEGDFPECFDDLPEAIVYSPESETKLTSDDLDVNASREDLANMASLEMGQDDGFGHEMIAIKDDFHECNTGLPKAGLVANETKSSGADSASKDLVKILNLEKDKESGTDGEMDKGVDDDLQKCLADLPNMSLDAKVNQISCRASPGDDFGCLDSSKMPENILETDLANILRIRNKKDGKLGLEMNNDVKDDFYKNSAHFPVANLDTKDIRGSGSKFIRDGSGLRVTQCTKEIMCSPSLDTKDSICNDSLDAKNEITEALLNPTNGLVLDTSPVPADARSREDPEKPLTEAEIVESVTTKTLCCVSEDITGLIDLSDLKDLKDGRMSERSRRIREDVINGNVPGHLELLKKMVQEWGHGWLEFQTLDDVAGSGDLEDKGQKRRRKSESEAIDLNVRLGSSVSKSTQISRGRSMDFNTEPPHSCRKSVLNEEMIRDANKSMAAKLSTSVQYRIQEEEEYMTKSNDSSDLSSVEPLTAAQCCNSDLDAMAAGPAIDGLSAKQTSNVQGSPPTQPPIFQGSSALPATIVHGTKPVREACKSSSVGSFPQGNPFLQSDTVRSSASESSISSKRHLSAGHLSNIFRKGNAPDGDPLYRCKNILKASSETHTRDSPLGNVPTVDDKKAVASMTSPPGTSKKGSPAEGNPSCKETELMQTSMASSIENHFGNLEFLLLDLDGNEVVSNTGGSRTQQSEQTELPADRDTVDGEAEAEGQPESLSLSTSEDSILSGSENGGSTTYHRFYHVFREGELDHLIEKYVENLHIISSYYDHANWCIIAEKVQVWRI